MMINVILIMINIIVMVINVIVMKMIMTCRWHLCMKALVTTAMASFSGGWVTYDVIIIIITITTFMIIIMAFQHIHTMKIMQLIG